MAYQAASLIEPRRPADTQRVSSKWHLDPHGPASQRLALWTFRVGVVFVSISGILRMLGHQSLGITIGGISGLLAAGLLVTALVLERHERRAKR